MLNSGYFHQRGMSSRTFCKMLYKGETHTYSHKSYICRWTCLVNAKQHGNNSVCVCVCVCVYDHVIYGDFVLRKKKEQRTNSKQSCSFTLSLNRRAALGGDKRLDSNSQISWQVSPLPSFCQLPLSLVSLS